MNTGEYYYKLFKDYTTLDNFPNSFLTHVKNNKVWKIDLTPYNGWIYISKIIVNHILTQDRPNASLNVRNRGRISSLISVQNLEESLTDFIYLPFESVTENNGKFIFNVKRPNGKIFKIFAEPVDAVNYTGNNPGGGTAGGDVEILYSNSTPTPVAIGGIPAGSTFNGLTMEEMWNMLLYPYQQPSITSLSTPKTNLEIGETLNTPLQVTWTTTNANNIKDGSVKLSLADVDITKPNLPKQGTSSFTITPITNTSQNAARLAIEMTTTQNKKITRSLDITWLNNIYYGCNVATTLDAEGILNLTKINANSVSRRYEFPAGGYKYIAIPTAWADIASFVDANTQFDIPMDKVGTLTITSRAFNVTQTYKVWRSTFLLNGSISVNIK